MTCATKQLIPLEHSGANASTNPHPWATRVNTHGN